MRLLLASCVLVGCGSQIRTELVGSGTAVVTARTTTNIVATPALLPRGTYDIDLRFGIPRAQRVEWKISCPGAEETGAVGEPFETFRERRLAELKGSWERRKHAAAAAGDPPPTATTRVRTPVGVALVRTTAPQPVIVVGPEPTELLPGDLGQGILPTHVRIVTTTDGACTIAAVADDPNVRASYSITRIRHLGLEAAERRQTIQVGAVAARGRVTATLVATGADVDARARRLEAEAKVRAEADRKRAEAERLRGIELARGAEIELRVTLEARQQADEVAKADAERRRLRLIAEAEQLRLRQEADAERARIEHQRGIELVKQRELELRVHSDLVIRQRQIIITTRTTIIAWLVGTCHADADRRGRIARKADAERIERERLIAIRVDTGRVERERLIRIRMEADRVETERLRAERAERERIVRIKLDAERVRRAKETAALAELELRRTQEAARIRSTVVGSLVATGATLRPPRPAPLAENPGAVPFAGAVWMTGHWTWMSMRGEWVWTGGGWRDTNRFGATGGATVVVEPVVPPVVRPGVVIDVGVGTGRTIVRDRDRRPNPKRKPDHNERW